MGFFLITHHSTSPSQPQSHNPSGLGSRAYTHFLDVGHTIRLHAMDESSEAAQNDDPSTSAALPEVIPIAPKGDILLDVTFETSKSTLRATRKAAPKPRPGQRDPPPPQPPLKPRIRLAYRVHLSTLKQHSRYFTNLLGDTRFQEATVVAARLEALTLAGEQPGEVDAGKLPRVSITDDDEATRSAGREAVFGDILRMLHGLDTVTKPVTMLYVVTLAVMADRFACVGAVSRYLTTKLKFKWPATSQPKLREDGFSGLSLAAEELVRQKVLASWLLEWPIRFGAATRDMIMFGSHRWSLQNAEEDEDPEPEVGKDAAGTRQEAVWWYLPDELEGKCPPYLFLTCLMWIPLVAISPMAPSVRKKTRLKTPSRRTPCPSRSPLNNPRLYPGAFLRSVYAPHAQRPASM